MNEKRQLACVNANAVRFGDVARLVFAWAADMKGQCSSRGCLGAIAFGFPSSSWSASGVLWRWLLRSWLRPSLRSRSKRHPHIEYSNVARSELRPGCERCGAGFGHGFGHRRDYERDFALFRREMPRLAREDARRPTELSSFVMWRMRFVRVLRTISCIGSLGAIIFSGLAAAKAEELRPMSVTMLRSANVAAATNQSDIEYSMFPKVRALSLSQARELATKRNTRIALAKSKVGGAQADLREQNNRVKVNTSGGLDPFSGKIRFYLSLDLERLLRLNKTQRDKARQDVEAQKIGETESFNAAIKEATVAWYSLRKSEAAVTSSARYRETARALYVAADARFKAGVSELSGVLSALDSTYKSDDAYQAAREQVALDCLDVAQACGYATAEEMEAAL